MEERHPTCYDIRKVKSILEESASPSEQPEYISVSSQEQQGLKRRKEASAPTPHGVREYMAKLYTYLLALATVGTHKVHGAPLEEVFGSDSTMSCRPHGTFCRPTTSKSPVRSSHFQKSPG